MLVCPSCRAVSPEGSPACAQCGKELKPGMQLLGTRRALTSQIDVSAPPLPPRWPRITAFAVAAAGIVAAAVWLAVRPGACDGMFTSDRFGYCVRVPQGWDASMARIGSLQVDQFVRQPATTVVMSVALEPGTTLANYARIARTHDRQAGLLPGPRRQIRLGDTPAMEWDLSEEGLVGFRGIEVVAVQGDMGWTVQLNDTVATLPSHVDSFRTMLSSWHFE